MSDFDKIKGWNPPSEGGIYLKLNDGDEVKVRLASLPVIFQSEFIAPDGKTNISTRFAFVVWNHDTNMAQVWVTNAATYGQQISGLTEDTEYGDWREYDVKIKRTGEKAQTRYNIRPGVKHYKLDRDAQEACETIDLIESVSKGKGTSQVYWLSDWRDMVEEGKHKNIAANDAPAEIEDIEDDQIDMSEIPF